MRFKTNDCCRCSTRRPEGKLEMFASKKIVGKTQFPFKSKSQLKHFLWVETVALNCHIDSMRKQWRNNSVSWDGSFITKDIETRVIHRKLAHFVFHGCETSTCLGTFSTRLLLDSRTWMLTSTSWTIFSLLKHRICLLNYHASKGCLSQECQEVPGISWTVEVWAISLACHISWLFSPVLSLCILLRNTWLCLMVSIYVPWPFRSFRGTF